MKEKKFRFLFPAHRSYVRPKKKQNRSRHARMDNFRIAKTDTLTLILFFTACAVCYAFFCFASISRYFSPGRRLHCRCLFLFFFFFFFFVCECVKSMLYGASKMQILMCLADRKNEGTERQWNFTKHQNWICSLLGSSAYTHQHQREIRMRNTKRDTRTVGRICVYKRSRSVDKSQNNLYFWRWAENEHIVFTGNARLLVGQKKKNIETAT